MVAERSVHPAAKSYDLRVGPFALGFARSLLEAVADVDTWCAAVEVLDHGAGTGLSSRLIRERLPAARVTALEPSAEMASGLPAEPWCTRVLGTVEHLAALRQFDAVVSNLVLMFCPDPLDTLRRLSRTVRARGVLAASVLGRADDVQPFHAYWTAVRSVRSDAWSPERYPHHRLAGSVGELAAAAGWKVVDERNAVVRQVVDPADAWEWLHGALPVGLGDNYGQLDASETARVQAAFLRAAPSEFVSHGTLLIATEGCS
jgi:SAM-dependent methyltransferase